MPDCVPMSIVASLLSAMLAVGLHVRAVAFEKLGAAPDAFGDPVERAFFHMRAAADRCERDRQHEIAAAYKVAGYALVLSVALFGAAAAKEDWCFTLGILGAISLAVPAVVLTTLRLGIRSSYCEEWDLVHYNKWTQEVIPPWPGFDEFFRLKRQDLATQDTITGARMHVIVALREVYNFVMKRGKGEGTGGTAGYDLTGWEQSLERLNASISSAVAQADLSSGQTELVDAAATAARAARQHAADLSSRGPNGRKLRDHIGVWREQWQTIDAIAQARQALGDTCPESDLEEIRKHLADDFWGDDK